MAKGIKRQIEKVQRKIHKQIRSETNKDSLYSRGLAYEGYKGGYLAALNDVLLALNGVTPNRDGWWEE